ncbi:Arc family DNA-binding protein [Streptomyces sp. KR80]|uniref:Arc family DNA-binding protein n=1 Tax=Streptomyces sp. KR80 TaxID=3457426 RepID=UPI003FD26EC5
MDDEVRITLRLPSDIHSQLTAQARTARRSLNSEIVHRLELSLGTPVMDAETPGSNPASPAPQRGKPEASPA